MTGFDRVHARTPPGAGARPATRVLFSQPEPPEPAASPGPPEGPVAVDCSTCHQVTRLGAVHALRVLVPGVHVPLLALVGLRRTSWLRCPACRQWSWARVALVR